MAAGLILRIPRVAAGTQPEHALQRFLGEEADGLFTHVLFDGPASQQWLELLESTEGYTAPVVYGILGRGIPARRGERAVYGDAACAATLGEAFSHGFAGQSGVPIHRALADTLELRAGSCVTYLPETTSTGGAPGQSLHDSVASRALPDTQRREMLYCLYGVVCAASGLVAISPETFVVAETDPAEPGMQQTGDQRPAPDTGGFEQLAAALGTPGTLTFDLWNDCLALIRARQRHPALAEESGERLLEAGEQVVALLRGGHEPADSGDKPSTGVPVLALANVSSEVAEARIDVRALPNDISPAMTDLLTGDTVFVPPSGDHIFSLDLEPYEVLWLELSRDSG
ncbi:MAG: hypothetical protein ACOCRN_00515 [Spirochaetia bacterium]